MDRRDRSTLRLRNSGFGESVRLERRVPDELGGGVLEPREDGVAEAVRATSTASELEGTSAPVAPLSRRSSRGNVVCTSGERGGVRMPVCTDPIGDGGTNGNAERMLSERLDAALSTDARELCSASPPDCSSAVGTVSVSRCAGAGNAAERGLSPEQLAGVYGTSVGSGGASAGGAPPAALLALDQRSPNELRVDGVDTVACDVAPLFGREESCLRAHGSRDARTCGQRCSPVSPNVAIDGVTERLLDGPAMSLRGGTGDGVLRSRNGSSRDRSSSGTGIAPKPVLERREVGRGGGLSEEVTPIVDFVPLRRLRCSEG